MKPPDEIVESAANYLLSWAIDQCRLREIVRRPFAVIDGEVVPVVYHCPEAMK